MSSKYDGLVRALNQQPGDVVHLTFSEIDAMVGGLPPSARAHVEWWANSKSHRQAEVWMTAGWRAEQANLTAERVRFRRFR